MISRFTFKPAFSATLRSWRSAFPAALLVCSSALAAEGPPGDRPAPQNAARTVTFTRDIAPIFQRRCQDCHRPGEIAPMSLLTYEDARPWARSIRRAVERREMPPWHADPRYGKFANDPRLSEEEIRKILAWVDAGAPRGDPADLPPPRKFVEGWRIGEPDLVLTMPVEFHVPAEGEVPYQYFTVPTNFTEDRWIQAADVRPGNPEVVHHIIVFVREPGRRLRSRNIWEHHLCGMAPGEGPDVFPPGTAKLVKKGSELVFQVHYTPSGKPAVDRSRVGFKFARGPVKRVHTRAALNPFFVIPPGADNFKVESQYAFRHPATLLGLMPHMHLRGKSFRYDLRYPDGREETLLYVPRWDFNWQHYYRFAKPLKVPRGAVLHCTAYYDNSRNNPANPDPTRAVTWGDQTWDEMMIGFLSFTRDDEPAVTPPPLAEETPAGKSDAVREAEETPKSADKAGR